MSKENINVMPIDSAMGTDHEVKHEIITAYNEILGKLKVIKEGGQEEAPQIIAEEKIMEEEKRIVELVTQDTADDMVENIAKFKLSMSRFLEDMKSKLLDKYKQFDTLQQAIEYSKERLKKIYGIEVHAETLAVLMLTQKEKSIAFEEELNKRKRLFEQQKLQTEMRWQQEENDYISKRDLARKMDRDQHAAIMQALEQELIARRSVFEEECEAREARLAARENEYQQLKEREARITAWEQEYQLLREKVARFPEELRAAIQRAERTAVEQLTRKYEYETKLSQIELNSERKLYEQKITALEQQIEQYKTLKRAFGPTDNMDKIAIPDHSNVHMLEKITSIMNDEDE
jgi:hypothetical protein